VVTLSAGTGADAAEEGILTGTAEVTRGSLAAVVSVNGTLTYRARPDGSPYVVVNQARGIYTELPERGARIGCGDVLYRVDDEPVLLLCGPVPAYRDLGVGAAGSEVRQLHANLAALGLDEVDETSEMFTATTRDALAELQRDRGAQGTGRLALADAVFLPDAVRVADVTGRLGSAATPNADALLATSDALGVQIELVPSQQDAIKPGDAARIALPGGRWAAGKVESVGTVARVAGGPDQRPAHPTVPAFVALDDPAAVVGLDQAPVRVDVTTAGAEGVLSVPVTALVGKPGGGYAVEVVRTDRGRELVEVTLGLFDGTSGRVEVEGDLAPGDLVVVPR
jgi:hypothetical protein